MKNQHLWQPSKVLIDPESGKLKPNLPALFPGSIHMAYLQTAALHLLIKDHIHGRLLDCGCGKVPYFQVYKDLVSEVVCLDMAAPEGHDHLDIVANLNHVLPFENELFDSILLTDVICHVEDPRHLMRELARVLKPGGKLVLSTPFQYWMSDYPHQYFHLTNVALELICKESGLQVIHLASFGGYADVMLDTVNKGMTGKWSNRFFRVLRNLVIKTRWYKRANENKKYHYSIGFTLVAGK